MKQSFTTDPKKRALMGIGLTTTLFLNQRLKKISTLVVTITERKTTFVVLLIAISLQIMFLLPSLFPRELTTAELAQRLSPTLSNDCATTGEIRNKGTGFVIWLCQRDTRVAIGTFIFWLILLFQLHPFRKYGEMALSKLTEFVKSNTVEPILVSIWIRILRSIVLVNALFGLREGLTDLWYLWGMILGSKEDWKQGIQYFKKYLPANIEESTSIC